MASKVSVLVVGASGKVGGAVVNNLLKYDNVKIKALVQTLTPEDPQKQQKLSLLKQKGVEFVVGSLFDKQSLAKATQGVDLVFSAASGGIEAITTGQYNLIDASVENKVKVIIPSNFGTYDENVTQNDNPYSYQKKQVNSYIEKKGAKYFNISNGAFYEFIDPFFIIDGKFQYFADENNLVQATSIEDIGKFTAALIQDSSRWDSLPTRINITGEPGLTIKKIIQYKQELGDNIPVVKAGTHADARKKYEEILQNDPSNFFSWFLYGLRSLPSEKILPPNPPAFSNPLFPGVKTISLKEFFQSKK